jgi:hypothetical protein
MWEKKPPHQETTKKLKIALAYGFVEISTGKVAPNNTSLRILGL